MRVRNRSVPGAVPDIIYYAHTALPGVTGPIREVYTAVTGHGVCAVAWDRRTWDRFRKEVAGRFQVNIERDDSKTASVMRELTEYFSGDLRSFSVVPDLFTRSVFERAVLMAVYAVPWGEVRSYGDVARAAGSPGASRAAGNALAKNPVPVIIPCHRVIKADGSLGGFGGGFEESYKKAFLLDREGVPFPELDLYENATEADA